jgi:hypothetical protein
MSKRGLGVIFLTILFCIGISLTEDVSAQKIQYGNKNGKRYYRYCYPNGKCTEWKLVTSSSGQTSKATPCEKIEKMCDKWNGDYSGYKTWCQCNYGAGAFCNTKAGNTFLNECRKIGGTGGCMLGTSYCQYPK